MNNNTTNNFLVGTIEEGITTNTKPWATQKDSWEVLTNMYQWRGRIVKKSPYSTLGQLSHIITNQIVAASSANFSNNLFSTFSLTGVTIVPGYMTITVNGGANYTLIEDPANPGEIIQSSGVGIDFVDGSINYLTGDFELNFSVNPGGNVVISFSYAYGLPVMGLRTRNLFELNEQDTIAFDTVYSYRYSNASQQFVPLLSIMPAIWSGTNSQFFFTTNYAGAFWATNFKPGLHGVAIFNITNAVNGVVSTGSNHGFTTGQTVVFINLLGNIDLNGNSYVITVTGPNTFTIPFQTGFLKRTLKESPRQQTLKRKLVGLGSF